MKYERIKKIMAYFFTNSAWFEHIHNANDIPVCTEFKVQTGCEMFLFKLNKQRFDFEQGELDTWFALLFHDYFLVTVCLSRFVAAAVRHLNMVRSHAPYTKPKPHYLWSLAKWMKCMIKRDTRLTYTLNMNCLSGGFWHLNPQN